MGVYTKIRDHLRNLYRLSKIKERYKISKPFQQQASTEIKFKNHSNPITTIIIICDKINSFSIHCLDSIYRNLPKTSFEILLLGEDINDRIDLSKSTGINVFNIDPKTGITSNINQAIKQANGKFIYLLNNNTIVHEGFLDEIHYAFHNFENVGAVGSMLLNLDGSLQEAGSYYLKNGVVNKITNAAIFSPEVNYIHQVDYCSSYSLLFEKMNANGELNLLDETLNVEYGTDLCLQLKYKQNKKIYYTPFSKITHYDESSQNEKLGSNTTDEQFVTKKDQKYLVSKWKHELDKINAETESQRIQELYYEKTIIFYHYTIPQADNNSGDLRLTEIIKTYASLGYHCAIIAPNNNIKNSYNQQFQKLGVRTYYESKLILNDRDFFKHLPKNKNQMWLSTSDIFLKYYHNINNYFTDSILIFDMVDIHHLRFQRALEFAPNNTAYQHNYKKYLELETECAQKADITVTISEIEREYMTQYTDISKLMVISNIHYTKVNLEAIEKFTKRQDLLFIGSSHHPNIDAINFLMDDILPLVWMKNPTINLNIVGDVNKHFQHIQDQRIRFLGYVPDVKALFLESRIMVAPLRYGAGVKGKIGQAFEYYLPVITSTIGAEGMFLENKKNALLADDAQEFADYILDLYENEELWIKIQNNLDESLHPFSIEILKENIHKIATSKS